MHVSTYLKKKKKTDKWETVLKKNEHKEMLGVLEININTLES